MPAPGTKVNGGVTLRRHVTPRIETYGHKIPPVSGCGAAAKKPERRRRRRRVVVVVVCVGGGPA